MKEVHIPVVGNLRLIILEVTRGYGHRIQVFDGNILVKTIQGRVKEETYAEAVKWIDSAYQVITDDVMEIINE